MTTISAALDKLNARVKAAGEAREAGTEQNASTALSSAVPSPAALQWHEPVRMGPGVASQRSIDERYYINAIKTQMTCEFTCWAKARTPDRLNERLGMTEAGPAARALCEAHRASGDGSQS